MADGDDYKIEIIINNNKVVIPKQADVILHEPLVYKDRLDIVFL